MKTALQTFFIQHQALILIVFGAVLWCVVRHLRMRRTSSGGVERFSGFFSWLFFSAIELLMIVLYRISFLMGGLLLFLQWLNRALVHIK